MRGLTPGTLPGRGTLSAVPVSKSKRSRYTPPPPKKAPPSPLWVPVALCVLMLTGLVVVLANYLQALPGNTENRYLILGLVLITSGFGLATTYR
jgi:Cell division protein CrgA